MLLTLMINLSVPGGFLLSLCFALSSVMESKPLAIWLGAWHDCRGWAALSQVRGAGRLLLWVEEALLKGMFCSECGTAANCILVEWGQAIFGARNTRMQITLMKVTVLPDPVLLRPRIGKNVAKVKSFSFFARATHFMVSLRCSIQKGWALTGQVPLRKLEAQGSTTRLLCEVSSEADGTLCPVSHSSVCWSGFSNLGATNSKIMTCWGAQEEVLSLRNVIQMVVELCFFPTGGEINVMVGLSVCTMPQREQYSRQEEHRLFIMVMLTTWD